MTEGVTTLVDYAGWTIKRYDHPEEEQLEWRREYQIVRKGRNHIELWLSKTDYQIFKIILEMADLKENGVKE